MTNLPTSHDTPTSGQLRAVGYVRVSTDEQVEHGHNLAEDRHLIAERCDREGWQLVDIYDDGGLQGDDPDRPALLSMLAAADTFDVVIIRAQDRITRDPGIWALVSTTLRSAGARLETFNGSIDLETPAGQFMGNVFAALGKFEKQQTGQRVRQAAGARRRTGKPHGGRRPFGYRYVNKLLVTDPNEAPIVRRMFGEADSGVSQRAIARRLNLDSIRTTTGARWEQGSVARILGNVLYVGKVRHKGADGSWQVFDGQHEAIVDAELFDRVQAARASAPRRGGGRPLKRGSHLLTRGLLRCGCCGEAMIPINRPERDGQEAYACRGRLSKGPEFCRQPSIRREVVDAALLRELTARYIDRQGTIDRLAERQAADLVAARQTLADTEAERDRADARLRRVTRGWQDGVIDDDDYRAQRAELLSEREAAENAVEQARVRVEAVEAAGAVSDAEAATLAHLADLKATVAGQVEHAPDLAATRTLIAQMIERVDIGTRERPYPPNGRDGVLDYPRGDEATDPDGDLWLWITVRRDAYDFAERAPRRHALDVLAVTGEEPTRSTCQRT